MYIKLFQLNNLENTWNIEITINNKWEYTRVLLQSDHVDPHFDRRPRKIIDDSVHTEYPVFNNN